MGRKAVLIAGPTASGKSALALKRAEASGGIVVNTDSMQVYGVLDVLTARPSAVDLGRAEHRLYGFVPPSERCSVGRWLGEVAALFSNAATADRTFIFTGGTGLYFETLANGIAEVPDVPASAVAEAEALVRPLDRDGRQALLLARDPDIAEVLREPDPQRLVRALSVRIATGRSLSEWQRDTSPPLLAGVEVERLVLDIDRDTLAQRIDSRFRRMLDEGALAEVETLARLGLDADLPAMKAIGVREISAWQKGEMSRDDAISRAVVATRQYAKRQRTWFRQRMADWPRFSPPSLQR